MRIAILQPGYLPWLGFFEQMYRCSDVFIIYDDVQYDKHSWRNRNRIKTSNGIQWLSVPVKTKGQNKPTNREVLIDNNSDWKKKHLRTLRLNYAKAPYFSSYIQLFEEVYSKNWQFLMDLDMCFISLICQILNLEREIIYSSSLPAKGGKVDRLINICKELGADTFYEGEAGKDYIDTSLFEKAGITLEFQEYSHPRYRQLHGEFISHLSIVDLIFNHGEKSLAILSGQNTRIEVI